MGYPPRFAALIATLLDEDHNWPLHCLSFPSFLRDKPHTTAAPTTTSVQCSSAHSNKELHLVLAFFAGVLLTLLLMALVFLIIKSYRKCHSSPQALDPRSDPAAKLSSVPEEALTYASMNFKSSEGKRDHLTTNHFSDSDPVVYAQIKATNSSCRSSEA